jgi:hypothetical protein
MDQAAKRKETPNKNKSDAKPQDNNDDPMGLDNKPADSVSELNPERIIVIEEISDLFGNEDIITAVKNFKADSGEKEIAIEFANSHIQFLNGIIESDYKKGIARTDVEIRDIISNANVMLQKKDEYLFTTIITHSPAHYRNIQKKYYARIKKEEKA